MVAEWPLHPAELIAKTVILTENTAACRFICNIRFAVGLYNSIFDSLLLTDASDFRLLV
jgi:hypothetical protein